jgi:DNA-binding transcriptional ArsR family regulator
MSESPISVQTPWTGQLEDIVLVLNNIARWKILAMLCRTEWLPVHHLAGAAGVNPSACSKHMLVLLKAKVVEQGFGRLYRIVPALRPAPGSEWLNLRYAAMKLPWRAWS